MKIESVCLLGATGFVGRSLAEQLAGKGLRIRALTRSAPRAAPLTVLPTVEVKVADVHDERALARQFEGIDAVVNLVGILHPGGGHSFDSVHAQLPTTVARACRIAGVHRLLQMSALGSDEKAPSEYLRSRAGGEAALREAAGDLAFTVFRPSVIFGADDRFLNRFGAMQRFFPVIPLGGAKARFQPIWVEDVARAFVNALGDPRTFGQTYCLCGPRVYTLEELVRIAGRAVGHPRAILPLPAALARLQAFALEHLPGRLMTRDNLRSMSVDNICPAPFPAVLGFEPSPLEGVLEGFAEGATSRSRYPRLRRRAGH